MQDNTIIVDLKDGNIQNIFAGMDLDVVVRSHNGSSTPDEIYQMSSKQDADFVNSVLSQLRTINIVQVPFPEKNWPFPRNNKKVVYKRHGLNLCITQIKKDGWGVDRGEITQVTPRDTPEWGFAGQVLKCHHTDKETTLWVATLAKDFQTAELKQGQTLEITVPQVQRKVPKGLMSVTRDRMLFIKERGHISMDEAHSMWGISWDGVWSWVQAQRDKGYIVWCDNQGQQTAIYEAFGLLSILGKGVLCPTRRGWFCLTPEGEQALYNATPEKRDPFLTRKERKVFKALALLPEHCPDGYASELMAHTKLPTKAIGGVLGSLTRKHYIYYSQGQGKRPTILERGRLYAAVSGSQKPLTQELVI